MGQNSTDFYSLCLRLLPWLQVSCTRIKFWLNARSASSNIHWGNDRKLKGHLPSQLGLKQLVLNRGPSRLPVGLAFPNLETLFVLQPANNFQLRTVVPSLTELVLIEIKQAHLEKILALIGRQLLKLNVTVSDTLIPNVSQTASVLHI